MGQEIDCPHKGRRLDQAFIKASSVLDEVLSECNAWAEGECFECGTFRREAQASVRGMTVIARKKIKYLDTVPWLLTRLLSPGIRERALNQYASKRKEQHHPISVMFLDESGELYPHVMALDADGCNASPQLEKAVARLNSISVNDTRNEGPHAQFKRVQGHYRHAPE